MEVTKTMQDERVAATSAETLLERWEALKQAEPGVRARQAAARLGVSEAELVGSLCGTQATRLEGDWKEVVRDLESLGEVMVLTRNDQAVHEVTGRYHDISFDGPVGLVLGTHIDLRLFMMHWYHGFAVETPWKGGVRRSLQFFGCDGTAVHKVFLTSKSDLDAYHELVDRYRSADQSGQLELSAPPAPPEETPDAQLEVEAFQEAWRTMTDTHEFFGLLRKYGITRPQAMRLAPDNLAEEVDRTAAVRVLELARDREVPIMVFVGSRGCIQIFTGPVKKLVRTDGWFNVLDPGFNLHLRDGEIDRAWIVRKPTEDGIVTALEVFDASGEVIALFFGERKPGKPEDPRWREIVDALTAG